MSQAAKPLGAGPRHLAAWPPALAAPMWGRATEVLVLLGQGQPLRLQPRFCPVALSTAYTRLASPDLKPPSRWRGCVQLQSHCSGVSASPVTSPG